MSIFGDDMYEESTLFEPRRRRVPKHHLTGVIRPTVPKSDKLQLVTHIVRGYNMPVKRDPESVRGLMAEGMPAF